MITKEVNVLFQVADPALKEVAEVILNSSESESRFLAEALKTDTQDILEQIETATAFSEKGKTL